MSLDELNEKQKEAVMTTEGYVRVIAGAGSGKTKALTNRYVYLVDELGISPDNIACITFTNKAANEMKYRIRGMIGDLDVGYISTIHGLCVKILRESIHCVNYPRTFMIMDEDDQDSVLKKVYKDIGVLPKQFSLRQAKDMICNRKCGEYEDGYIDICSLTDGSANYMYQDARDLESKIYYGYIAEQRKNFALDFDDLILFTLHILLNNAQILRRWQEQFIYIMVDEFQDVSFLQYKLITMLADYNKNLFVVGDPDQTIYSWRGANVELILDFDKDFKAKTIVMDDNYRSTDNVLAVSNSLIQKNVQRVKKDLFAKRGSGDKVQYHHCKTQEEEGNWVADKIKDLHEKGMKYANIAILYRAHYVSRSIEEALMNAKVPYVLYSGTAFYARKEIKDILSYMRLVAIEDDLSFMRIINEPKRGIGQKRLDRLVEYQNEHGGTLYQALKECLQDEAFKKTGAKEFVEVIDSLKGRWETMPVLDITDEILQKTGYEKALQDAGEDERLDNIAELCNSIQLFDANDDGLGMAEYLQDVSLFTNTDKTSKENGVKLMTIHTAKGLEFPCVFVVGMNEGVFPGSKIHSLEEMEEERRIAYVAFTRAEDLLFITDSEGYTYNGGFRYPSRFIFNIDENVLNYRDELDDDLIQMTEEYISRQEGQGEEHRIGDRVFHKAFGFGDIIDVDRAKGMYLIQFDEIATPRKIRADALE